VKKAKHKMSQNSRMSITGKNSLIALLIAFTLTVVLTFIYSCMASFLNFNTTEDVNVLAVIDSLSQAFVSLFKFVGMCAAPIVFLLSFALLQRFRIKDNSDTDGTEEDEA